MHLSGMHLKAVCSIRQPEPGIVGVNCYKINVNVELKLIMNMNVNMGIQI